MEGSKASFSASGMGFSSIDPFATCRDVVATSSELFCPFFRLADAAVPFGGREMTTRFQAIRDGRWYIEGSDISVASAEDTGAATR